MRILIVGNSPLAFFVAQGLNNDIARYTHLEVLWLTDDRELIYLPTYRLLAPNRTVRKSSALPNVRLVTDKIRSVSLPNKRVITEKRVIEFDILFLDQTPWYTQDQLNEVGQALQKLVVHLKAKKDIRARGAIRLKGAGPLTWQLALLARHELNRLKYRQVVVEIERPKNRAVAELMKESGLSLELSTRPGFTVAAPLPAFESRKIKGMRIDRRDRAITDGEGIAGRGVIVAEQATVADRTLLRALESQARIYAAQLERLVTQDELLPIDREPAAFLLKSDRQLLFRFDKSISRRVRAQLIYRLELNIWKRLLSRHG